MFTPGYDGALAGASTIVAGLMLLVGTADVADFDIGDTTEYVANDWWWWFGLVVGEIIAQFTDVDRRRESLGKPGKAARGRRAPRPP